MDLVFSSTSFLEPPSSRPIVYRTRRNISIERDPKLPSPLPNVEGWRRKLDLKVHGLGWACRGRTMILYKKKPSNISLFLKFSNFHCREKAGRGKDGWIAGFWVTWNIYGMYLCICYVCVHTHVYIQMEHILGCRYLSLTVL